MKKAIVWFILSCLLFVGCAKNEIAKTYPQSEDGVMCTYYEMKDGTWKCDDVTYKYRLELEGRTPNAAKDSQFVVLTDNQTLTFEVVSKSLYSSSMEEIRKMEGSKLVEIR